MMTFSDTQKERCMPLRNLSEAQYSCERWGRPSLIPGSSQPPQFYTQIAISYTHCYQALIHPLSPIGIVTLHRYQVITYCECYTELWLVTFSPHDLLVVSHHLSSFMSSTNYYSSSTYSASSISTANEMSFKR